MDIKFVSYTGRYPNLCSGQLTLLINGCEYKFGTDSYELFNDDRDTLPKFWESGGDVFFDSDYDGTCYTAPWQLGSDYKKLPTFLKGHEQELIDVFNANVPYGCCGGCL